MTDLRKLKPMTDSGGLRVPLALQPWYGFHVVEGLGKMMPHIAEVIKQNREAVADYLRSLDAATAALPNAEYADGSTPPVTPHP